MRPEVFDRNLAPLAAFRQRPKPHAFGKTVRNTGVQLGSDFPAASLSLDD
jgi:hypothetical protein